MAWSSPYALVYVAISLAMAALTAVAYRNRGTSSIRYLAGLAAMLTLWTALSAGRLLAASGPVIRLFDDVSFLAIALIPVLFLLFAEEYTGHGTPLTRYGPGPLLVVPAVTQVVVWTNPAHHLMWTARTVTRTGAALTVTQEWGPWFWVHSAYSYLLIAVGSVLLLRMLVVSETYRGQATAVVLGVFFPWVTNALYIFGIYRPAVDTTPMAFAATILLFSVAIYRHKFLQMVPMAREMARDELMDNLAEAVLIVDEQGQVIDCNARARAVAGEAADSLAGERLDAVLPELVELLDTAAETDDDRLETELTLRRDGDLRHFEVQVTELHRGGGLVAGKLISLQDVTERRQREQRLNVLNRTLRHDLRNEANVILGYAELGKKQHPDAEWVEDIQSHISGMVDLSAKVRQLEQALDDENVSTSPVEVSSLVEEAITEATADRPEVDVETDLPAEAYASAIDLVDAAVTNALENAIEHNDNPDPFVDVAVEVRETDEAVVIEIRDNGPGIHEDERDVLLRGRETQLQHGSGLGLWMINWIVTESGGSVTFDENDPRGSVVTIRLPNAEPGPDTAADDETTGSTGMEA